MAIKDIYEPLKKGQELANAVAAKNLQAYISAVAAFVTSAYMLVQAAGYEIPINKDIVIAIATYAGGTWMIISTYITLASSKKVGIGKGYDPSQSEPDLDDEAMSFAAMVSDHNTNKPITKKQYNVTKDSIALGDIALIK